MTSLHFIVYAITVFLGYFYLRQRRNTKIIKNSISGLCKIEKRLVGDIYFNRDAIMMIIAQDEGLTKKYKDLHTKRLVSELDDIKKQFDKIFADY